jgi:DNA-binding protein Fis
MALLFEKSKTLHEVMLNVVYQTLKTNEGNRTKAAKELGVTVRCVRKWIAKFDELDDFRNESVNYNG